MKRTDKAEQILDIIVLCDLVLRMIKTNKRYSQNNHAYLGSPLTTMGNMYQRAKYIQSTLRICYVELLISKKYQDIYLI